jgi:hypothetical protein
MRLIDEALRTWRGLVMPSWEELAKSPAVAYLLDEETSRGDLARRIQWGASEPLPGWQLRWTVTRSDLHFQFVDVSGPGGFTLSSRDPCVIPRTHRIVPLGTNQE